MTKRSKLLAQKRIDYTDDDVVEVVVKVKKNGKTIDEVTSNNMFGFSLEKHDEHSVRVNVLNSNVSEITFNELAGGISGLLSTLATELDEKLILEYAKELNIPKEEISRTRFLEEIFNLDIEIAEKLSRKINYINELRELTF